MKSLESILRVVVHELGRQCKVPTSRDLETVARRVKTEGDSFLTITLPSLCAVFDQALAAGVWERPHPSFKRGKGGLPRFLSGFLSLVFTSNGVLRSDADIGGVAAIRQILLLCKKVRRPTTPQRERKAEYAYVRTDEEITDVPETPRLLAYRQISSLVATTLFSTFSSETVEKEIKPSTGPGAVAERLSPNGKFSALRWTERLNALFPEDLYALSSLGASIDQPGDLTPRHEELPVRVVFVPKTLKTPRVIAIEPNHMQYVQQGLMRWMYDRIPRSRLLSRAIVFADQTANREWAKVGSFDGSKATIDLSEASDRVSLQLVRELLAATPYFCDAVMACRSERALLPSGELRTIRKFASMGSALCFPIEALVFLTIVLVSAHELFNVPVTPRTVRKFCSEVKVYGDDIIVPTDWAPGVVDCLQFFGLKVNRNKTFVEGNFRESCGGDFFKGEPVNPVYIREDFPSDTHDSTRFTSWVETCNLLYKSGLWETARELRCSWPLTKVKSYGNSGSAGLVWHTYLGYESHTGWDPATHRFTDVRWCPSPVRTVDKLDGYAALLKWFVKPDNMRADHLESSVRAGALSIKRRKVRV